MPQKTNVSQSKKDPLYKDTVVAVYDGNLYRKLVNAGYSVVLCMSKQSITEEIRDRDNNVVSLQSAIRRINREAEAKSHIELSKKVHRRISLPANTNKIRAILGDPNWNPPSLEEIIAMSNEDIGMDNIMSKAALNQEAWAAFLDAPVHQD